MYIYYIYIIINISNWFRNVIKLYSSKANKIQVRKICNEQWNTRNGWTTWNKITLWSTIMIMICDIPETLRAHAKCIQRFVCSQNLLLIELTVRSFYRHLYALIFRRTPSKVKNTAPTTDKKRISREEAVSFKKVRAINTTQKKMARNKTNGFLAVSSRIFLPLTVCWWWFPLIYLNFSIRSWWKIEILFLIIYL